MNHALFLSCEENGCRFLPKFVINHDRNIFFSKNRHENTSIYDEIFVNWSSVYDEIAINLWQFYCEQKKAKKYMLIRDSNTGLLTWCSVVLPTVPSWHGRWRRWFQCYMKPTVQVPFSSFQSYEEFMMNSSQIDSLIYEDFFIKCNQFMKKLS